MAESIHARGLVQGVGFRPFVCHLPRRPCIRGRVWNDGDGVCIQAWGDAAALGHFRRQLREGPPPMARIDALESVSLEDADMPDAFVIVDSRSGPSWPAIAPDAAICPDCLRDILDPTDRHHHYPLTSCSHCGPRLSILRAMPFDRAHTSMADFAMCPACREEYADAADRRFHAQAHAGPTGGPATWLEDASGTRLDGSDAIAEAVRRIQMGQIVAIKGIGGVHLAVDAGDGAAVARLRARKRREAKPFALMARDVDMVAAHAEVDSLERQLLTGREAPIVLLDRRRGGEQLVDGVAPGQGRLGFMLPYTPLYAMLMAGLARPIVLSSGNRAEAPACTGNGEALRKLAGIADAWLLHEREIVHRLDDSVAAVAAGRGRLLRRAGGYAPAPLPLPPPEWVEWGNPVDDPAAFDYIAGYCPYSNVRRQRSPDVLATGGLTDPRVTYWEPAKWVARLRAHDTGGACILLRLEMDARPMGAPGRFDGDAGATEVLERVVAAGRRARPG